MLLFAIYIYSKVRLCSMYLCVCWYTSAGSLSMWTPDSCCISPRFDGKPRSVCDGPPCFAQLHFPAQQQQQQQARGEEMPRAILPGPAPALLTKSCPRRTSTGECLTMVHSTPACSAGQRGFQATSLTATSFLVYIVRSPSCRRGCGRCCRFLLML